jgi:hypothetical protein
MRLEGGEPKPLPPLPPFASLPPLPARHLLQPLPPLPPGWDEHAHWTQVGSGVVPASAEVSVSQRPSARPTAPAGNLPPPAAGPDLQVGVPSPTPGKTLSLEHADDLVLAGRPRWEPPASRPAAEHDPAAPSTWVSQLAFSEPTPPAVAGRDVRIVPVPRKDAAPRPASAVTRFVRRVRGASRAFFHPESVRGEAGDFPQLGQGVERAAAHRLDEPAKR